MRIFLAIAFMTFAALYACDQGLSESTAQFLAKFELPDWEPAAEREVSDRPEDAFQRAWNSSELRAERALKKAAETK
jgi:hypothetical protein